MKVCVKQFYLVYIYLREKIANYLIVYITFFPTKMFNFHFKSQIHLLTIMQYKYYHL